MNSGKDSAGYGAEEKERDSAKGRERGNAKEVEGDNEKKSENYSERQLEKMRAHLKELGILDELERLPMGCHTPLGKLDQDSVDLSGGQWQRVAIARALLRRAPVVIMDEPAAALDPSGEAELYDTLLRGDAGPLRILITHRLGCVRDVDEILVLSGGRVAERGPHEALLAEQGLYAEMFALQRSWYV